MSAASHDRWTAGTCSFVAVPGRLGIGCLGPLGPLECGGVLALSAERALALPSWPASLGMAAHRAPAAQPASGVGCRGGRPLARRTVERAVRQTLLLPAPCRLGRHPLRHFPRSRLSRGSCEIALGTHYCRVFLSAVLV
eukprot:scaffold9164_cov29-Tisochrysis_lutea.AAC.1